MSDRYTGGVIRGTPLVPTGGYVSTGAAASGVFSLSQQQQLLAQERWVRANREPRAPTIGSATVSGIGGTATVSFTAPSDGGGTAISSYTVTSSPGNVTASGASSPITISGLTNGTSYTFTVTATNSSGTGPASAPSNSVVPFSQGQQAFTTWGSFTFVVPNGVTSISAVAVGRGGFGDTAYGSVGNGNGGGGGALSYSNNVPVTPGESLTVYTNDYDSNENRYYSGIRRGGTELLRAEAGISSFGGGRASSGVGQVKHSGGSGSHGGGGAAGYQGVGGTGGSRNNSFPTAGEGGGGGGGGRPTTTGAAPGGGGVGLLGLGSNGAAGADNQGGGGGSGGSPGRNVVNQYGSGGAAQYGGGGGGGGARYDYDEGVPSAGNPGDGAVRIIWPGNTRSFPNVNTGDL